MKDLRMNMVSTKGGFTLIEILLAIGILAILATAAIIAINPARQFAQARNTQRWNDVHAIMNAVYQYAVANKGLLPPEIPGGEGFTDICTDAIPECSGIQGFASLTTESKYLTAIPVDPSCVDLCDPYISGYSITINTDGRVRIAASHAELGETIELVR